MICKNTGVREQACACVKCTHSRQTPVAKFEVNKRDVMALLDHIAGCVDSHPILVTDDDPSWGHVGTMSHIRKSLIEVILIFAVRAGESEEDARRKIEAALDEKDEYLTEALIEASV